MINPINECKLFDTPATYDDLLAWCRGLSQRSERAAAIAAMHMTLNLAHHIVQNAINEGREQ